MEITDGLPSIPRQNISSVAWQGQWVGIVGVACILAFSWIPNSYNAIVSWPWILLWQGAFLLIGAWNVWILRQFSIPFRLLGYGLDWIVGIAFLSNVVSALNAEFVSVACWNVLLLGNYVIVFYLLVNWLRQGLPRQNLWLALSFVGTVTSIFGLSFWRPSSAMWLSTDFYDALRNPWPLGHHNFVGGYELLMLPVASSFCLSQQGWRKWLGFSSAGIVAVALYVSGSRGAMVGAIAVLVVTGAAVLFYKRNHSLRSRILTSVLFLIILLVLVFSNPRIRTLFQFASPSQTSQLSVSVVADGPTQDRLFMLQSVKNIFSMHPITGVGPGNLSRVYNLYRPIDAGSGLNLVQQLHNMPAQILAELGAVGLIVYSSWLVALCRLIVKLYSYPMQLSDRAILYGISASYLGYSLSSLTDYQLENFGISSTLIVMAALLINLSDTYTNQPATLNLTTPKELSPRSRKFLSLSVLSFLCVSLQIWIRFDTGLYLSSGAAKDVQAHNIVAADAKWARAGKLLPWDPTYSALAAEQLAALRVSAASKKDEATLTESAIEYFELAMQAAPSDPWFNQNLAALLIESGEPKKAEPYASYATLLFPRNHSFTYYTLGMSYLGQGNLKQAATAFFLEGIANPRFLIADLWATEPFSSLLPEVLAKTFDSYRHLLVETSETSSHHMWLDEQLTMLKWWYGKPLTDTNPSTLRPLLQSILEMKQNSRSALSIVEQHIDDAEDNTSLQLIRAWLSPKQYLDSYLKDFKGTQQEKELLIKHIENNRDIRLWMNSVQQLVTPRHRRGASFAYRNAFADYISQVMHPGQLRVSLFSDLLGLFPSPPVVFPQLDQEMSKIKDRDLLLSPLSDNGFQLPQF